jgi:hypothetical protein
MRSKERHFVGCVGKMTSLNGGFSSVTRICERQIFFMSLSNVQFGQLETDGRQHRVGTVVVRIAIHSAAAAACSPLRNLTAPHRSTRDSLAAWGSSCPRSNSIRHEGGQHGAGHKTCAVRHANHVLLSSPIFTPAASSPTMPLRPVARRACCRCSPTGLVSSWPLLMLVNSCVNWTSSL